MQASGINVLVHRLRRTALVDLTDRQLLDALVTRRDEAAFETLLTRHGPMVLAVCRRALRNVHDAEDAFQATFMVLIRNAPSIRRHDAVGSWLFGVAYRTAQKMLAMNAKRDFKERQAATRLQRDETNHDIDLDEALNALPEKYRIPIVLCELEGRSRKQVARELKIPEGTLSSRLATARKMLATRLGRRGWSTAGAVCGLPALLVTTTVKAAGPALAGREITGIVSANVIALSEGVMKAMFVNKLKIVTCALVVLGALGVGSGRVTHSIFGERQAVAAEPPPKISADTLNQAAADLAAAKAALKQAEANLAAARAQVAMKEALFERTRKRTTRPDAKAESGIQGLATLFRHRVPVEIGLTETHNGGRIEILEVWGTRPAIEIGGQYVVRGKYVLPTHEQGTLYFYETATSSNGISTTLDLQQIEVKKGEGEFTLMHSMAEPGHFHLILTGPKYSDTVANVYFGTGDNVLRK